MLYTEEQERAIEAAEKATQHAEDDARRERYIGSTGYVDPADYEAARCFG